MPGALLRNRGLRFLGRDVRIVAGAAGHAVHRAGRGAAAAADADRPRRGLLLRRRRDARRARARRPGPVPVRRARTARRRATRATRRTRTASLRAIAGVLNARGNVAGLMPHPERAADALLGSDDGLPILRSLVEAAARAERGATAERCARGAPDDRRRATGRAAAARRRRGPPAAAAASRPRADRRGARRDPRPARARPERPRARDVQRHVARALLVQELEAAAARRCRRAARASSPGPGENAGVVSIGDGLAVAFKLESHNHPSAVEPYQGAATGVGGILRDIFTMGARPIAVLDALRFGDPAEARTRHLVDGVVRGVGGYGNCVGVPTVGGELVFDPSYADNPLVNVMAIGAARGAPPDPRGGARARATSRSCSGARPAATASGERRSSPPRRSPTTIPRSGPRSRSAIRSPRSC